MVIEVQSYIKDLLVLIAINSIEFLFFFVAVTGTYFLLPSSYKWMWLLAASYFFYGYWNWRYLILILASTTIDYVAGIKISETQNSIKRKWYFILSITFNLSILFTFKYFNFFIHSFQELIAVFGFHISELYLKILLPVGISFYTFQSMSYTIGVFRNKIIPERHFGLFALFVGFWPQSVAGPIEKADKLLPQLRNLQGFNYVNMRIGLVFIAVGLFKKMVIADLLGIYVDEVFMHFEETAGLPVTLGAIFFAFQVYLDFSAYSDIAVGCARIMGVELTINFRRPFLATSVSDFWSRWHISLMNWIREYLYIPLGGNRKGKWRSKTNVLIVFLLSGLWHGASWHHVLWGGSCGVYLLVLDQVLVRKKYTLIRQVIHGAIGFVVFAYFLTLFRAPSVEQGIIMMKKIGFNNGADIYSFGLNHIELWMALILIFGLYLLEILQEKYEFFPKLFQQHLVIRWTVYLLLTLSIIYLGVYGDMVRDNAFVYFQF